MLSEFPKPRIVISKCIGFDPCRYNGEIVQDKFVAHLEPHLEFVWGTGLSGSSLRWVVWN